jgi:nucleoside-diphosphate-sugar epimerase
MRTVITGSQGALGRAVVAALASRGDEIAVINRKAGEAKSDRIREIAGGDLSDVASWASAVAEAHAILGGGRCTRSACRRLRLGQSSSRLTNSPSQRAPLSPTALCQNAN